MKVIIAGGRDFEDYDLLCRACDYYLSQQSVVEIVQGGARGADALGKQYALERGYTYHQFDADWDNLEAPGAKVKINKQGKKYNAAAGMWRNADMAEFSEALIAFWDGVSPGTKSMIELARKKGLKVKVINYGTK